MSTRQIRRVIISVYDKTGIIEFAKELKKLGAEIISTGGSYKALKAAGIKTVEVSEVTSFPEILDGRVKTLHPSIHGGLLAIRKNKTHFAQLKKHKIEPIDAVVVNLYPFEEVLLSGASGSRIIENIDIGGVAMLRAAAKNFNDVLVVSEPSDYKNVIEYIKENKLTEDIRKCFAAKAFKRTAYYDSIIADYLSGGDVKSSKIFAVPFKKIADLRYGENPHQSAGLYKTTLSRREELLQLQGKELSYNNYLDADSAYGLVCEFRKPSCVIVKHNNPCGAASDKNLLISYKNALSCDQVSAFGGIVAFNKLVDGKTAQEVVKVFTECIVAPEYSKEALEIFESKKDMRVLKKPLMKEPGKSYEMRTISSGVLLQERDSVNFKHFKQVTKKKTTTAELESLKFAMIIAKYVKSNAIILTLGTKTVGIGAGQMSRIDALKIASSKFSACAPAMKGQTLVLASDAFFPFNDVVLESHKLGVKAIIQPGGSINDGDSIKACDELDISMLFTGMRHFRH